MISVVKEWCSVAVPKYNELMPYVIQALGDGNIHTIKELEAFCVDALQLSVEDRQELLPSGRQTALINRLNWAKTYLQKAGLVVTPKRGNHQLTDLGKKAFADGPEKVTLNYLKQFDSYNEFVAIKKEDGKIVSAVEEVETKSPQDMLDEAISQMNASLEDDLMTEIMKISSYEFERLVVRLLLKMGYGTLQLNKEAVTQKTNDEGIDGIVTADKFSIFRQNNGKKTQLYHAQKYKNSLVPSLVRGHRKVCSSRHPHLQKALLIVQKRLNRKKSFS